MGRRSLTVVSGFTLIEVMISMFFLAFIVGEMAMISTYSKRSTNFSRRVTEANMLGEGVLEKSRNSAYTNLSTRFSALDNPPDPIVFDLTKDGILESYNETCATVGNVTTCTCTPDPTPTVAGDDYTITRTVSPFLPSTAVAFTSSTAVDVDIVVGWSDDKGVAHQIKLSTVRTKF